MATRPTPPRHQRLALLAAVPLTLAGCASAAPTSQTTPAAAAADTPSHPPSHPPSDTQSDTQSMTPGMTMHDGTTVPPTVPRTVPRTVPGTLTAAGPSASARMVCSTEIRHNIQLLLALKTPPHAVSTWANHVYTCTYHLTDGPLVLSVRESGTLPAARSYFHTLRQQIEKTTPITGLANLGLPAFEAPNGTVAFLKDDKTLQVDATALPPSVGAPHRSRTHLAYTIATDVLACWNGD